MTDYQDPLGNGRPLLAGYAPVGHTGFVVIVQSDDKPTWEDVMRRMGIRAAIAAAAAALLILSATWYRRRRNAASRVREVAP
jgi:hypothetical protein